MKEITLKEQDIKKLTEELVYKRLSNWLSKRPTQDVRIWGVPRGGVAAAYRVADMAKGVIVDSRYEANVIIDDIICTGKTKERIAGQLQANAGKRLDKDVYFDALVINPAESEWYVFPWEGSRTGSIEDAPLRMLQYIGEDPTRNGLIDTPSRIVRSWDFLFSGYNVDIPSLFTTFDNDGKYDQMVILKDIEFYSMCEHHALPFFGKVHIAYLPGEKIVGVSKLARVVEAYSRRLQVQERLTEQVATALEEQLQPKGVAVYIEAQHLCMVARGVQKQNSVMVTSSLKGHFRQDESRMEFLLLSRR